MILVIGGECSGKRAYVINMLGYEPDEIADGVFDGKPVLDGLHKIVMSDPGCADDIEAALLAKDVVICNEVGAGVVPIDRAQREGREAVGRLCIRLADKAERVVRLHCGIAQIIKD